MERFINILKKNYILVILVLLGVIFLTIFAALLEDVWTKDPKIISFDINVLSYIKEHRTNFLNDFFKLITDFGDIAIVLIISAGLSLFLFFQKRYTYLIALLITLAADGLFIFVIKDIVKRARPEIANALINENGFSFPSGHAFIAVCFYGLITYFIFKVIKKRYLKIMTIFIGVVLILLIAFSRIYLGVHWTSDVIASTLLSSTLLMIVIYSLESNLVENLRKRFIK